MINKIAFATIIFFLPIYFILAQNINGVVIDKKTGEPIYSVVVKEKGTDNGTITNLDGTYSIQCENNSILIFSSKGYLSKELTTIGTTLNVSLISSNTSLNNEESIVIQLEPAMVTAESVDIAKEVIGKLISIRAKQQSLSKTIQCSTYVKSSYKIGDKMSLLEFLSYSSYKRPGEYRDFIVAIDEHFSEDGDEDINISIKIDLGNSNSIVPSQSESIPGKHFYQGYGDGNVELFSNTISLPKLMGRKIPSPLGFDSFLNYNFHLISIEGEPGYFTYNIGFKSKNKNLLNGKLKIEENGWVLKESILEFGKSFLLDFDGLRIQQTHIMLGSGAVLVSERYFDWFLKSDSGSVQVIHSDISLNNPLSRRGIGMAIRSYSKDAYNINEDKWSSLRQIPLALSEQAYVNKEDSLILYFDSDEYVDSLDAFVNKLHWYEPVFSGIYFRSRRKGYSFYLDPLISQFRPLGIGGWRQNVGAQFSRNFKNDKRLILSGYGNYGYTNQDLKGEIEVKYLFNPKRFQEIEIAVGDDYLMINNYESILGTFARRNFARGQYLTLAQRFELINGLFVRLSYKYAKQSSISGLTLNTAWDSILGPINQPQYFPDYTVSIAGLELHYRIGQRFIMKGSRKLLLGSKYPELVLEYRRGIPNWFGSNVDYHLLRFNAFDNIQWPRLGYSNWSFGAGSFLGSNLDSIRFIEHKFFRGSDQYLMSDPTESFQALDSTYNTARPYIELYGIHHFQGAILQQIPLLSMLNLEIAVGGSALFIPSLDKRQIEIFVGLERPFKFFDEVLKYGVYYVTSQSPAIRQGFRFKIGLQGYDRYQGNWGY